MSEAYRNYNAFQYLLKKKPREYRGAWDGETYYAYHLYQVLIPGTQVGRYTLMFSINLSQIQNAA